MWLEPRGGAAATARRGRKLLNAEKVVFRTGPAGGIMFQGEEVRGAEALIHVYCLSQPPILSFFLSAAQ